MSTAIGNTKKIHQGRNVKRFREMLGLKQEILAYELGDDWNQKRVSLLEAKEIIEDDLLEQVAKVLKVPADAIKNFNEEAIFNIIGNTYHDTSSSVQYQCTINPMEKWLESLTEIKQLHEENKKLYERLLLKESEMLELLKNSK